MSTLQQRLAQLSPAKAALLAQWQRASLGPNCISVRAGGPQQLFCIHPVSGDVSPYVELAAALPAAYGCIALRASDVDIVYLTGYGFPRGTGGPMFHAETVGLDKVVARMQEFAANPKAAPDFWQPAKLIVDCARNNKRFDQR